MNYLDKQINLVKRIAHYSSEPNKNALEYVADTCKQLSDEIAKNRQSDISVLCESLQDEIEDIFISELITDFYWQDRINELSDNWIPIYNYELAQYLANDFSLAYVEDEGLIEGETDIFKIIQISIYERLTGAAYEKIQELKDEKITEFGECLNDYAGLLVELELIYNEEASFNSELNQSIIDTLYYDDNFKPVFIDCYFSYFDSKADYYQEAIDVMEDM